MTKWRGIKTAQKKFTKMHSGANKQLNEGLENFASSAENATKEQAVFIKGYSTGHLRRAIMSGKHPKGFIIASPAEYSGYVEHGTRYMEAQPFFFKTVQTLADESLVNIIMKR